MNADPKTNRQSKTGSEQIGQARPTALVYVNIEDITVEPRHRAVNAEKAEALARSMREIGLRTPVHIVVRDGGKFLVAGAHRLAAARLLGWREIQAIEIEESDPHADLWEIDENLARLELTATEQTEHLSRRQELWEKLMQSASVSEAAAAPVSRKGGRGKRGFAKDTAEKTGVDKSTVARGISRANRTTVQARAIISGTKADTGSNLDKLKKHPREQQAAVARQMVEEAEAGARSSMAANTAKEAPLEARPGSDAAAILRRSREFWDAHTVDLIAAGIDPSQTESVRADAEAVSARWAELATKLGSILQASDTRSAGVRGTANSDGPHIDIDAATNTLLDGSEELAADLQNMRSKAPTSAPQGE
jgi:ParB-like chromosome segregation protein Spo0J